MTPVAVKAGKRRAVYLTFAVYAFLGLLLSGLMTILLVDGAGWEFWRALAVSVLVIVVLIPAWLALFVAGFVVWYKASTSEKAMIARARKRAKEEGAIVELGPHRVWYAGDADPSALVNEQLATSRSRAEALLGGTSEPEKPMRIFLFNRRDDFEAFLRPFLPHAWCFDGFPLTPGTFAISTEDVPSHVVDVATTLLDAGALTIGAQPVDWTATSRGIGPVIQPSSRISCSAL